jgi:hypothetical protein
LTRVLYLTTIDLSMGKLEIRKGNNGAESVEAMRAFREREDRIAAVGTYERVTLGRSLVRDVRRGRFDAGALIEAMTAAEPIDDKEAYFSSFPNNGRVPSTGTFLERWASDEG